MKKCGWWKGHCLHKVDGTERKVKRTKKKRCANEGDYVYEGFWGQRIDTVAKAKCCWCGKEQEMKLMDFDIMRAMNFPDYEEKK